MDLAFRMISNVDIGDLVSHMVCDSNLVKFQLTIMSNFKSLCNDLSGYLVFSQTIQPKELKGKY